MTSNQARELDAARRLREHAKSEDAAAAEELDAATEMFKTTELTLVAAQKAVDAAKSRMEAGMKRRATSQKKLAGAEEFEREAEKRCEVINVDTPASKKKKVSLDGKDEPEKRREVINVDDNDGEDSEDEQKEGVVDLAGDFPDKMLIKLKEISGEFNGRVTIFKVKPATRLTEICEFVAKRRGVTLCDLRFMIDGCGINPDATAAELGLDPDEKIDCFPAIRGNSTSRIEEEESIPGWEGRAEKRRKVISVDDDDGEDSEDEQKEGVVDLAGDFPYKMLIKLTEFGGEFDGRVTTFKVKPGTRMMKVYESMATRRGVETGDLALYLSSSWISPDKTAAGSGLGAKEWIECYQRVCAPFSRCYTN